MDFSKEIASLHTKIYDAIVNTPNWIWYFGGKQELREILAKGVSPVLYINYIGSNSVGVSIETRDLYFDSTISLSSFETVVKHNYDLYHLDFNKLKIGDCKKSLQWAKELVKDYEEKLKKLENETI